LPNFRGKGRRIDISVQDLYYTTYSESDESRKLALPVHGVFVGDLPHTQHSPPHAQKLRESSQLPSIFIASQGGHERSIPDK
jgi:hypothetical protein